MSKNDVYIVGAGIHPFGRHDLSGLDQGVFAVREALQDASMDWPSIQFAFGGSSAAGAADAMMTSQFFALIIRRFLDQFGISEESLGRVSEKAFENAAKAPHAWRRQPVDFDTIMSSQMLSDPLRKFMFCSPAEGGAALILASEKKARELGRTECRIHGAAVRTRPEGSFEVFAPSLSVKRGQSPTELASVAAFEMAGLGPDDIDVAQLQDTESGAEIKHMAENGYCKDGEQEQELLDGEAKLDGRLPVNTDGGCLACGEPIGASGLRQVYENVIQVRGSAGDRQVEDVQIAYSQVYGAPGLSAVCVIGA